MTTLEKIPHIAKAIKNGSTKAIQLLHKFIFSVDAGRKNRKQLRDFTGFPKTFNITVEKEKRLETFSDAELICIANLLSLEFTTDADTCCTIILNALQNFELLIPPTTSDDDESDTNDLERQTTIYPNKQIAPDSKVNTSNCLRNENISSQLAVDMETQSKISKENFCSSRCTNSTFSLSFRDLSDTIKYFNGSSNSVTIESFIQDIEELFALNDIQNEVQKIVFTKKCLTGSAKTFVFSLRGITTFDQLKQHLLEEFSSKLTSADLHKLLQNRHLKPNESLSDYFIAMREISSRGQIDISSVFDYVINGIPDTTANKIILFGCKTVSEFKEKLKIYEKVFLSRKQRVHHSNYESHDSFRNNHITSGFATRSFKKVDQRLPDAKQHITNFPNIICFNCGLKGHESRNCLHKSKGFKCFNCNEFGHKAPFCPQSKTLRPAKLPQDAVQNVNYQIPIRSTSMHIQIKIKNTSMDALLDTGSEATLVNETTYKMIGSPSLDASSIEFTGMGQTRIKPLGYFNADLQIQNTTFHLKIHVIPDKFTSLPAIIGADCIQQAEFSIGKNGIHLIEREQNFLVNIVNVLEDKDTLDLSHIPNANHRAQVHALNQELLNAKSQISATPEKTNTEGSKTLQKTPSSVAQSATEVKHLKEQLIEAQQNLKSLQEKLDITNKSCEQYLSMCQDLEIRVKEQDEINKQLQESMNAALNSSKEAQASLEKSLENMEKTNRELIEENMKLSQNSGSQVDELQKKITELTKSIEDYKNQAEVAKKVAEQARIDCQNQMKLMEDVQEKYKRELKLHAQDMQAMTTLKKEHQSCSENFEKLKEEAKVAAENNALKAEVKNWQSKTNQLLEQSHRIGPQEYKNKMREIEELKSQKTRLAEELQKKQAEVSQMTANTISLKKEHENSKNALKEKNGEIAKMTRDIAEHNKTLLQIKKIGRKYKTQFDELKVKYDDLEAKSKTVDSTNQEQALQEVQKKLEETEKNVKELKEEIEKEKKSATLSKQAQSKASEKEEKAIKLLTQFRQKYSQVNNQKESLSEDKKKLLKEKEELKSQIAHLMVSQEENSAIIARLEKELRTTKELHNSEREMLLKLQPKFFGPYKITAVKPSDRYEVVKLGNHEGPNTTSTSADNMKPWTKN